MNRILDLFSGIGMFSYGLERAGDFETIGFCENNPYAQRILRYHWPWVPVHDDVRTLGLVDLSCAPDVICGGFPCFPRGTFILTKRGLVDISSVTSEDFVWTHKDRWRQVKKIHGSHIADTVRLQGFGHPSMVTTRNHPFMTKTGEWVEAGDMKGARWVTSSLDIAGEIPDTPSWVKSKEAFFWCVGRWVADGWVTVFKRTSKIQQGNRGSRVNSVATRVHWGVGHKKASIMASKLAEAGIITTRDDSRTSVKFIKQSKQLGEFLLNFGKGASNKQLPGWVLSSPTWVKQEILAGYLAGDGNYTLKGWQATTTSKSLAISLRLVATSLGWSTALYFSRRPATCVIEGRVVNQKNTWQIRAEHKRNYTGLVRSVKSTEKSEEVFNFEVEEDNSYVADGLIVHNCQGISAAGKGEGLADSRSGLWYEYLRVISETRPRWVIIENVPVLRSRGLEIVLGGLASIGYSAWYDGIPASWFGAPHRRDRIWIVAHTSGVDGGPRRPGRSDPGGTREHQPVGALRPPVADADRQSELSAGHAAEAIRGGGQSWLVSGGGGDRRGGGDTLRDVADYAFWARFRGYLGEELQAAQRSCRSEGGAWYAEPGMGRLVDGRSAGLVGGGRAKTKERMIWENQIQALGNSLVWPVPMAIGRAILRMR